MTGMETLRQGDLMFGPIGGFVPGVVPVGAGQVLIAPRKVRLSWRRWWHVRHAGMVTGESETLPPGTIRNRETGIYYPPGQQGARPYRDVPMGDYDTYATGVITAPRLVQAMPRGAEEIDMSMQKHWTPQHIYIRPAYDPGRPFDIGFEHRSQGFRAAEAARRYIGTPYNFLTYGKLAAGPLGLPITEAVLRRWISTRTDMMCSQLVDQALADAGFHVFDDGRLPQDVVPSELFRALMLRPGTAYLIPGRVDSWADAIPADFA